MSEIDGDAAGREEGDVVLPSLEIAWPPATFELMLRKPVTFAGEVYDRLSLREPTDAEMETIFKAPEGTARRVSIATVTGIPTGAVALMAIGDTVRAEAYLLSFFDIGQVIGAS